ncbi:MAG: TAXI family TRAP transporter solute-binding subunit [Bacillota bacterium]|nr:TAXI family TRAP transporter solute-binding subunit [Bacillota bacterium]MDW7684781.1 TAXI family TRAP transporter solute-binding subunit [Bacillota bacterium]
MKRMKWLSVLLVLLMVAALAVTAGCTQPAAEPDPPEGNEEPAPEPEPAGKSRLTMASGWVTGVYYPLSGAMSRIAYENMDNISLSVESSGASVANAKLIGSGDADLAILQNDIAFYAFNGEKMFEEAVTNIQGAFMLYPEPCQIVVQSDSGITSPADLKGKRVAVGPLGSGTEGNAAQILEAYGLTFDDITVERLTAGESADFLKDGRIDAAFFTVGVGASAIADLALLHDVTLVEIDDEHAAKLIENYPYYSKVTIPADTYSGIDATQTVTVLAMVAARAELSEEVMYEFTKGIFENLESIHNAHDMGKEVTLESALEGMPLELHPGTAKYFKEKGIM